MFARTYKHVVFIAAILFMAGNLNDISAQNKDADTIGIIERIVEKFDTVVRVVIPDSTLEQWSDKPIDSMLFKNNSTRFKKEQKYRHVQILYA